MKENINLNPNSSRLPDPGIRRKNLTWPTWSKGNSPVILPESRCLKNPAKTPTTPSSEEDDPGGRHNSGGKRSACPEMISGQEGVIEKGKPGKIFILASSDMIKDNLLDPEGRGANDILVMNVLDYLNDQVGRSPDAQQAATLYAVERNRCFHQNSRQNISISSVYRSWWYFSGWGFGPGGQAARSSFRVSSANKIAQFRFKKVEKIQK